MSLARAIVLLAGLAPGLLLAQVGRPSALPSLPPEEAAKSLADFRASGLTVDLAAKFELRHLPRDESKPSPKAEGRLWMSWRHAFPAARVDIGDRSFLVLRSASGTKAWMATRGGAAETIPAGALRPLLPGFLFSTVDLQAPFADWKDTSYLGSERRRGRPLNLFLAKRPGGSPELPPAVRFGLDRAYLALIEATALDDAGKPVRTMRADDFAQVDEVWILGKASVTDERTRDRDLLEVREASVKDRLPAELFAPAYLGQPAPFAPAHLRRL